MLRILLSFMLICLLASCAGRPSLNDPKLSELNLDLEEFFEGDVIAYGQFQDRFGTVRNRFKVDITGTFDGKTLILEESFVYSDKSTQNRTWTLIKLSESEWKGSAPDVIGDAKGKEIGDLFNWQYSIDLPVGGELLRVKFDDWMWLLSNDRLLNKAYVQKYGINIGEVIIYFEKIS
ncbi:MAG: DUF3833 domain-containing protein [Pseudomonadota bacterium]|nr:DUF3833 domain-containing protein [Pseudomonadota bacterium]